MLDGPSFILNVNCLGQAWQSDKLLLRQAIRPVLCVVHRDSRIMALPWANPLPVAPVESPVPGEMARVKIEAVKLEADSMIEVRWQLEEENEEGVETKRSVWWGAKVIGPAAAKTAEAGGKVEAGSDQGPSYELLYEPRDAFPEEKAIVAFMDEHVLCALGQEGEPCMWWRKKGDDWEEPPDSSDEEEEEDVTGVQGQGLVQRLTAAGIQPDEDGSYSAADVLGVVGNQGREDGSNDNELMAGLDPYQQRVVAERFQHLMDSIKERLQAVSDSGRGMVTEEDVHEMFASATKKQRRE